MNKRVYRPQRRLRSEFLSLLLTFAVPAALALLMYAFLRALPTTLVPTVATGTDAFGSLIFFTPAQEVAAVKAIRSAWHPGLTKARAHTVDLTALDLPESEPVSILSMGDCVKEVPLRVTRRAPWPRPFSLAAPAPRPIAPQNEATELKNANPFTRAELLKIED